MLKQEENDVAEQRMREDESAEDGGVRKKYSLTCSHSHIPRILESFDSSQSVEVYKSAEVCGTQVFSFAQLQNVESC